MATKINAALRCRGQGAYSSCQRFLRGEICVPPVNRAPYFARDSR